MHHKRAIIRNKTLESSLYEEALDVREIMSPASHYYRFELENGSAPRFLNPLDSLQTCATCVPAMAIDAVPRLTDQQPDILI